MPIYMPTPAGIVRASFGLEANTQTFSSPLNRAMQRVALPGSRWMFTGTIRRMRKNEDIAGRWIAFFLQCQGRTNAFQAYDPDRKVPRGVATGAPLVKGANQTGTTLNIDGATASVAGWLRVGDYFAVNGELKQLIADANTNAGGETILNFMPALRNSPPDNAAITLDAPTCSMILTADDMGIWEADVKGIYEEKTFSAMEVF